MSNSLLLDGFCFLLFFNIIRQAMLMLEQFCNEEHVNLFVAFHDVSWADDILTSKEIRVVDGFLGTLYVRWLVKALKGALVWLQIIHSI